jgi:hypothetical protein
MFVATTRERDVEEFKHFNLIFVQDTRVWILLIGLVFLLQVLEKGVKERVFILGDVKIILVCLEGDEKEQELVKVGCVDRTLVDSSSNGNSLFGRRLGGIRRGSSRRDCRGGRKNVFGFLGSLCGWRRCCCILGNFPYGSGRLLSLARTDHLE